MLLEEDGPNDEDPLSDEHHQEESRPVTTAVSLVSNLNIANQPNIIIDDLTSPKTPIAKQTSFNGEVEKQLSVNH